MNLFRKDEKSVQMIGLFLATLLQSAASLFMKLASSEGGFTSLCLFYYGVSLLCLGVYAVAWQLLLEKMQLSVAYLSNGLLYVFMFIWATVIFRENVSFGQIAGCAVILSGIVVSQHED